MVLAYVIDYESRVAEALFHRNNPKPTRLLSYVEKLFAKVLREDYNMLR